MATAGGVSTLPSLIQPIETVQPTVRVMRLYKPGFHIAQTYPAVSKDFLCEGNLLNNDFGGAECTLSSHLLLPDSFGDIYLGEKFSAYIAVVNGFIQAPFYNVTLNVRLQTATTVVDLIDIRTSHNTGSSVALLSFNESSEVIVQHTLNELGTHTLRVSVQYTTSSPSARSSSPIPSSSGATSAISTVPEIKTLRKFYRFNVLQPLIVLSSFREMLHKPMVQCQVTNSTKSPIFIEEMNYVSNHKNCEYIQLHESSRKKISTTYQPLNIDDILILQPEESYAFAFEFRKFDGFVGRVAGFPIIKWCNAMGESSIFRGENTLIKSNVIPTALLPQPIKFSLVEAPSVAYINKAFSVRIKVCNTTSYQWPVRVECANLLADIDAFALPPSDSNFERGDSNSDKNLLDQGLFFTGLTAVDIGSVEASGFRDIELNVVSTSGGLYDLPIVFAVHAITRERHPSGVLCQILVIDPGETL